MAIKLPDLPYAYDALAPHMSEKTLRLHHGEHHQSYVDKLNDALDDDGQTNDDLPALIKKAYQENDTEVFNNAGQVWNHTFFWECMSPEPRAISKSLAGAIDKAFGSADAFRKAFKQAATGQFGSGWAWLVSSRNGALSVVSTANAEPAFVDAGVPLVACDVWEHAYYLDYQNDRGAFIKAFLDNLVDWHAASTRYEERVLERKAA